ASNVTSATNVNVSGSHCAACAAYPRSAATMTTRQPTPSGAAAQPDPGCLRTIHASCPTSPNKHHVTSCPNSWYQPPASVPVNAISPITTNWSASPPSASHRPPVSIGAVTAINTAMNAAAVTPHPSP